MADKIASPVAAASPASASPAAQPSPSKKTAGAKAKIPRAKPAHPRTSDMVTAAIQTLKERGGSSLQAIKKYIATTYKIDADKQASFIKKYLKSAVASGALVQTKGKGASGSFKISTLKAEVPKPKVQRSTPKVAAPKKKPAALTAAAKKPAAAKKSPVAKKASTAVVAKEKRKAVKSPVAKPVKVKTPSKAKKAVKAPTSKPKAPKPKKAAAAPKTAKPAAKKPVASKKK